MKESTTNRTKAMRNEPFNVNGLIWKDCTSYSRNSTDETKATSFETNVGGYRISILMGHIYYPNQWIFNCHALGFNEKRLPEGIDEIKAAEMAFNACKLKVNETYKAFNNY